ncbi:carbohydrate kinase family protein [Vallitalea guaymasensis]|uniref:carbohydrate kinase family protein n=1 Tax=Vallitalea guaymasensis TaxID=1185412 RepID=UPI000DE1F9F5|nr:carbohydrate kinase [Vallitalea guaymasensis]
MPKLITIGEALIDFIPNKKQCRLKEVEYFTKSPGGAPANVAACASILGSQVKFISKLGYDAFGDFLIDTLKDAKVNVDDVLRTTAANTGLAFVSLTDDGERDFSFYRNPSADMLLEKKEIRRNWFSFNDILHFCSIDLVEAPVKYAHLQAIEYAIEQDVIISFDPNVRLSLWNNEKSCRKTILEFIPCAHIIKISNEELEFITGIKDEKDAIDTLFKGNVKMVIYTKGKDGVEVITKKSNIRVKGFSVEVIDTTGAGDSFIGSFLYQLLENGIDINTIDKINKDDMINMLSFSNACSAIVISRKGVINILPNKKEVNEFLQQNHM